MGDVISLLGSNVDAESYEGDVCGDTLANTRCYAQMTKVKDEDLDSCGKSLVRKKWSDQAEETMGDYLCGQVHRWLKRNDDYKANGRDNIEMAFMYSECGNEWTEISSSIEGKLVPKEPRAAQTRESSEGVTAQVRGSLAPRSKKLL